MNKKNMNYIDEFNNFDTSKKILESIYNKTGKEIRIMEVCGTHTTTIVKNGIKNLLPKNIKLISGPGCPICVTPTSYIDAIIDLTKREDIIISTFGDVMSVPGSKSSLKICKALGKDIRVIYSPLQAIEIAKKNSEKEVIFLGIGFETTAPIIAIAIDKAKKESIKNFSVFQSIKTMPSIIRTILSDKNSKINGLICPGHVATIIGVKPFEFLEKDFEIPSVIAGFQCCDVVSAIYLLMEMINNKKGNIKNIYNRVVKYEGNKKAREIINKIFIPCNTIWRGLGNIENSALEIRKDYKEYDAKKKFNIKIKESTPIKDCICNEILIGSKSPLQCKLFRKTCNLQNPVGVCMASREGTCAIYYKYG